MSHEPTAPSGAPSTAMGFHTTHWTVVLSAGVGDGMAAREALAELCSTYWPPLYAFIRRQGARPHEAEDLTQEFFCRLLDRNALIGLQPAAGKFRSFLLACLKNFLVNERARATAQRRGGGCVLLSLDYRAAENQYLQAATDDRTPDVLFEQRWAHTLLAKTLAELRLEYANEGKSDLLQDLEGFLPGGRTEVARTALAAKRGVSVGAIDVAVHRLRKRFGALLRQQVARTVACEAEVDEELRHLISILSS